MKGKAMNTPAVVTFIDENIKLNEKGKQFSLADYQRVVSDLMWAKHYAIRLWSEPKKSGKTFFAACVALSEAVSNPDCEVVCVANDEEQALSRVFQTAVQLIKYNPELTPSATVQQRRSSSPTAALFAPYRATTKAKQAAGRS
jgi:phage terminase large subunit-like protein